MTIIDTNKYFKPLIKEVDYEFQEHLTDHLLTDILNQNEYVKKLQEEIEGLKSLNEFQTQKIETLEQLQEEAKQMYCNGLDEYKNCISLQSAKHRIFDLQHALDEIEKYCEVCKQARTLNIEAILQTIKQVKENNNDRF